VRKKALAGVVGFRRKGKTLAERKEHNEDVKAEVDLSAQAVARYLADMTGQLESMARASKWELLAYLLAMARAEAENVATETSSNPNAKPRG
jgi:hypothetical protein